MSAILEGRIDKKTLHMTLGINRLDASVSREFKREFDALWSPDVTEVEVDLNEVDFVDSSGVGALLGVYKRVPENSGIVILKRVKAPVQSVIELLQLHRIFEIQN